MNYRVLATRKNGTVAEVSQSTYAPTVETLAALKRNLVMRSQDFDEAVTLRVEPLTDERGTK